MESKPFDHKPAYGNEYLLKSAAFIVRIQLPQEYDHNVCRFTTTIQNSNLRQKR